MIEINYLQLARTQFYDLKSQTLIDYEDSLGAENEMIYEINNNKFKIIVDGYWEKYPWFDWIVLDEQNNEIISGTYS